MKSLPELLKIRLSAEDKKAMQRAADLASLSLSAWARTTLVQATNPLWSRFQPNHEVAIVGSVAKITAKPT